MGWSGGVTERSTGFHQIESEMLLISKPATSPYILNMLSLSSQGPLDWRTGTKRQRGTTSKTGNYRLQLQVVDIMLTAR